jgi:hypothetical protein
MFKLYLSGQHIYTPHAHMQIFRPYRCLITRTYPTPVPLVDVDFVNKNSRTMPCNLALERNRTCLVAAIDVDVSSHCLGVSLILWYTMDDISVGRSMPCVVSVFLSRMVLSAQVNLLMIRIGYWLLSACGIWSHSSS